MVGNITDEWYMCECYHCGSRKNVSMYANRARTGGIVGFLYLCDNPDCKLAICGKDMFVQ